MDSLDGDAEAILVDDGPTDRTRELMQQAVGGDRGSGLVRLSGTSATRIALTAGGIDVARGCVWS